MTEANTEQKPIIWCIGGVDPSGGAGLSADILAVSALGGHACPVSTAMTVQNANCFESVEPLNADLVIRTLNCLASEALPDAIKVGLLVQPDLADFLVHFKQKYPSIYLVLDPVLKANTANSKAWGENFAIERLALVADVVTPNSLEARSLAGVDDLVQAISILLKRGYRALLVKGAHENKDPIVHELWSHQGLLLQIQQKRKQGEYRGTGCRVASSIAYYLSIGDGLLEACQKALQQVWLSLDSAYYVSEKSEQAIPCLKFI
jgi:hydroxymethylpyrimidine/phosphomethylpyrimidine kinase